jgi:hypothetical protein
MSFLIDCPSCGRKLSVTASQAGMRAGCDCGAGVDVPRLSQLREQAGKGAYESGTIDTILRMIDRGELPWGDLCAISGRPTKGWLTVRVEAERLQAVHSARPGPLLFLFGPLAFLTSSRKWSGEPPVHGRETTIDVPLRIHGEYHEGLWRRPGQRRLRRLLRTVPIYDRLLKDFPAARLSVVPTPIPQHGVYDSPLDDLPA